MSDAKGQSESKTIDLQQNRLEVTVEPDVRTKVNTAIETTQKFLHDLQNDEGYYIGELFVDTTVANDYWLYCWWVGEADDALQARVVQRALDHQQEDGGWNQYEGAPSEVNCSVKCYLTLKMAGYKEDHPVMVKARKKILELGGIPAMNTYGKLYLALVGMFPWKYLPTIPSEAILFPNWFIFNIYELSSWTRAMFIPLAIINHHRPTKELPEEMRITELYPNGMEGQDFSLPGDKEWFTWRNFFLFVDDCFKLHEKLPWKPFRKHALKRCEEWMVERMGDGSDGLGAIFPSMMNSLIVMRVLGYPEDHPLWVKNSKDFHDFAVVDEENDDFRVQPCFSPVWDTAISTVALGSTGVPKDDPRMIKAADWLLEREVRRVGDWVVKNPEAKDFPSGWAFEFNNDYYCDVDDTCKVLLALRFCECSDPEKMKGAVERSMRWARTFQCKDGGFAAFDKDVTQEWLNHVPFADHNAILDPACSDITARYIECMGKYGMDTNDDVIQKAIQYLKNTQEEDGSWYGRWGVNYIYGTWQSLRGMHAIGADMEEDWLLKARQWLESCQNPDGGWGETCESYDDPSLKGQGPSTPSQTAWALMGLLTTDDPSRPSILRAVNYLTTTQSEDGRWEEKWVTGTGFPSVFYLQYDMYRTNWPTIALGEFRDLLDSK